MAVSKMRSDCSVSSNSDGSEESWISTFCTSKRNKYFCHINEAYIQDQFNLVGLKEQIPFYQPAYKAILDEDVDEADCEAEDFSASENSLAEEREEEIQLAAEHLYGLIHSRYILSYNGVLRMLQKYLDKDFEPCPRVLCKGQIMLPMGLSDIPRTTSLKMLCPKCNDIYTPKSKYHKIVDGAYFGPSFPHMVFMVRPELRPFPRVEFVPRLYGFQIHPSAIEHQLKEKAELETEKENYKLLFRNTNA